MRMGKREDGMEHGEKDGGRIGEEDVLSDGKRKKKTQVKKQVFLPDNRKM